MECGPMKKPTTSGEAFLKSLDIMSDRIRKAYDHLNELEAKATSVNIAYNKIGGTNHGHTDKTGHGAILIQDQREHIQRLEEEYKIMRNLLRDYLKQISHFDGATIIKYRFLYGERIHDLPDIIGKSERVIYRDYNAAVRELSALIDSSNDRAIRKYILKPKYHE